MDNVAKLKISSALVGLLLLTLVACPTPAPDPIPTPTPTPIPVTFPTFGQFWGDSNAATTLNAPGCDQTPVRTSLTLYLDDSTAPDLLGRMSLGLVVPNPSPSARIDFAATVTTSDEITGTLKGSSGFSLPFKGNVIRVSGAATQIRGSYAGPGGCVVVGGTSIVGTATTQFTLVPSPPF
jgi:hypothetical protein